MPGLDSWGSRRPGNTRWAGPYHSLTGIGPPRPRGLTPAVCVGWRELLRVAAGGPIGAGLSEGPKLQAREPVAQRELFRETRRGGQLVEGGVPRQLAMLEERSNPARQQEIGAQTLHLLELATRGGHEGFEGAVVEEQVVPLDGNRRQPEQAAQ